MEIGVAILWKNYLQLLGKSSCKKQGEAFGYFHSSNKIIDIIQEFLNNAFKSLIDYINDSISKEMMLIEEEQTQKPSMVQNIGTVNGTVMQGSGTMSSVNTTIVNDLNAIVNLINRLFDEVDRFNLPYEEKENVKDDLEIIFEQVQSATPKKIRLQKAINGIKKFISEFSMKYAISQALSIDWNALIIKAEAFISTLG